MFLPSKSICSSEQNVSVNNDYVQDDMCTTRTIYTPRWSKITLDTSSLSSAVASFHPAIFLISNFAQFSTDTTQRPPYMRTPVTGATYPICCVFRAPSGVAKGGPPPSTRIWVATRKRIAAAGSTTNRVRSGSWASKPSTDCSIGVWIRWCIASAMRGNVHEEYSGWFGGELEKCSKQF